MIRTDLYLRSRNRYTLYVLWDERVDLCWCFHGTGYVIQVLRDKPPGFSLPTAAFRLTVPCAAHRSNATLTIPIVVLPLMIDCMGTQHLNT